MGFGIIYAAGRATRGNPPDNACAMGGVRRDSL
jgi:hypothetical protein